MAINSIAIKQIVGAWAFDSADKIKWMCSQAENLKINQDGQTTEKKDAQGSTIFSIDLAKSCQITFDSSVLDLSLVAALNGTTRIDADSDHPINVPNIERFTLKTADVTNGYVSLNEAPIATSGFHRISFHTLTADNSLEDNYEQVASAATSTKFYYDSANNRIYFPTNSDVFKEGCKIEIIYEYQVTAGVQVVNAADKFPDASKVRFLVLAVDLCDQTRVRALWLTAKNAKPSVSNTVGFSLEDTISVTLNCAYDYCDSDKSFYDISIADKTFSW